MFVDQVNKKPHKGTLYLEKETGLLQTKTCTILKKVDA